MSVRIKLSLNYLLQAFTSCGDVSACSTRYNCKLFCDGLHDWYSTFYTKHFKSSPRWKWTGSTKLITCCSCRSSSHYCVHVLCTGCSCGSGIGGALPMLLCSCASCIGWGCGRGECGLGQYCYYMSILQCIHCGCGRGIGGIVYIAST